MLDVQAGSPVILAPVSSQSKDLLVINLGNLTLRNQFLLSGTPGTIIHKTSPPKPHPEDSKPSEESSKPARETPRKVATAHGLNLEDSPGLGLGTAPGVLTRASTRAAVSKSSHGPQYSSTPKHSPRVADEASEAEVDVSKKKEENMSCLLDCIQIDLEDMDLYPAERVSPTDFDVSDGTALIFPSFIIQRKVRLLILSLKCFHLFLLISNVYYHYSYSYFCFKDNYPYLLINTMCTCMRPNVIAFVCDFIFVTQFPYIDSLLYQIQLPHVCVLLNTQCKILVRFVRISFPARLLGRIHIPVCALISFTELKFYVHLCENLLKLIASNLTWLCVILLPFIMLFGTVLFFLGWQAVKADVPSEIAGGP